MDVGQKPNHAFPSLHIWSSYHWAETCWMIKRIKSYIYSNCLLWCRKLFSKFSSTCCTGDKRTRHSIHIAELLQRSISTLFCETLFLLSSHRQSHYWVERPSL
ncbi:uncharacterized protein LOC136063621 [Quercus suber]|uniref:uncharacterized protein LOC136063621 n=1 Tax=Quercus suber TaxID=58331 RepID=UPI0032DE92DF